MEKMIHEALSRSIIGIAMEVLNELKPGLDEKLYERALAIELRRCGHAVALQSSFPVSYRGEMIGNLIPDMIVDDLVDRGWQGRIRVHRQSCGADDRLLEHHGPKTLTPPKLQKRQPHLEACGQRARARKRYPAGSTFSPSVKSA